jgi:hypothetical protein
VKNNDWIKIAAIAIEATAAIIIAVLRAQKG